MHIVQICNCANCAKCAVVLGRVVVLVGEIIMMAKGMFAADPPHPSLPSTMQPMFRAQPNITSNVWSTPQQCSQCLQLSRTSHPTEHYIKQLKNWTLNTICVAHFWTHGKWHHLEQAFHDVQWWTMNIADCTVEHLTCWPTRSKWSQMVVCS